MRSVATKHPLKNSGQAPQFYEKWIGIRLKILKIEIAAPFGLAMTTYKDANYYISFWETTRVMCSVPTIDTIGVLL